MGTRKLVAFLQPALLVAGCVLLAGMVGCSKTGTVTGKVTYKGKPVPMGTVTFHPAKDRAIRGSIQDGTYTLEKVPAGEATVTVETASIRREFSQMSNPSSGSAVVGGQAVPKDQRPPDPRSHEVQEEEARRLKEMKSRMKDFIDVPAVYGKKESSKLKTDVRTGKQEFDIELR